MKCVRVGIMVTDLRPTGNQRPPEIFDNAHEERGMLFVEGWVQLDIRGFRPATTGLSVRGGSS